MIYCQWCKPENFLLIIDEIFFTETMEFIGLIQLL